MSLRKKIIGIFRAPVFHSRRGQFLVEAIIASSILTIGLGGIMALLASSLGLNRKITDNYIATYLAAEGIELTKNILDHNVMLVKGSPSSTPPVAPCTTCAWNDGFAGGGDFEADYQSQQLSSYTGQPLLLDPGGQGYAYGFGDTTGFVRKAHIDEICRNGQVRVAPLFCVGGGNPPVGILVKSTVTWSTGLFNSQVNLEDRFYDWRP